MDVGMKKLAFVNVNAERVCYRCKSVTVAIMGTFVE